MVIESQRQQPDAILIALHASWLARNVFLSGGHDKKNF